jgi:hypothetical protein
MPAFKILGFFDFHITADKARDFFIKNEFGSHNLVITGVTVGQKFGEMLPASGKGVQVADPNELSHHTIIDFFKHLFHFEGKQIITTLPYLSDREGFILTVNTTDAEQKQVALEALKSHGASFVKEM